METGIRGKKTRRWGNKIGEPTAHNHSPDSAQLRLECVIRDRPDVRGTEHRFGLAKKGKKGYKGHSGQRWKMSTPEAEGFLQVVLTLNWAKSQWRRERRVSFDISVAYGGSELSDTVRTAGRMSQHSQDWTTEPLQKPGRLRPRIFGAAITSTENRIDQLITISERADADQEVAFISSGPSGLFTTMFMFQLMTSTVLCHC